MLGCSLRSSLDLCVLSVAVLLVFFQLFGLQNLNPEVVVRPLDQLKTCVVPAGQAGVAPTGPSRSSGPDNRVMLVAGTFLRCAAPVVAVPDLAGPAAAVAACDLVGADLAAPQDCQTC